MPKGDGNRGKGRCAAWIFEHVNYQGADCLIWPFSKIDTGYGQLGYLGKIHKAHRFMCEQVNGPPPSPTLEAAHTDQMDIMDYYDRFTLPVAYESGGPTHMNVWEINNIGESFERKKEANSAGH